MNIELESIIIDIAQRGYNYPEEISKQEIQLLSYYLLGMHIELKTQ